MKIHAASGAYTCEKQELHLSGNPIIIAGNTHFSTEPTVKKINLQP
jgi:hypothetical protein